jgi:predicted small secreted protein
MKTINKIALLLLLSGMIILSACNKNYYSGSGKGGGGCGCPSHKGMSGY